MDWVLDFDEKYETQIAFIKKLDKLTLYDHNSVLIKDQKNLKFTCILNCKRLNRQYSILGKIQGDLFSHSIQIICGLVDFKSIVTGKWQHQKIQRTKFAYRYNQKSAKMSTSKTNQVNTNYQIKVNPINGQFYVCYHFLLGYDLIKDSDKFKMKMTDQCQKLTSEAQKIFNTIIQVIFDQQANDPYLKSDQRVGMNFTRPVKVGKLLKKMKKINTISNIYKIKQDIAAQNKHRSVFKKLYLKKTEKTINNPIIIQNALVYIPKFCKKHLDALPENAQPSKRKNLMISPFQDLQDNHEIQFATRHLQDFSKNKLGQPILQLVLTNEQKKILMEPGRHQINGTWYNVQQISRQKLNYQYELLSKLGFKYSHFYQYYHVRGQQFQNLRITQWFADKEKSLQDFLQIFGSTISLSTRLDIMTQICHAVQVFHKFHIGYFIDFQNIFITEDNIVKIKDFTSAYSVSCWDETKQKDKELNKKQYLMANYKDYLNVCGNSKEENHNKDKMDEENQKWKSKFESQRADIFTLGMVLYKILLGKYPFSPNCISALVINSKRVQQFLLQIWTVQTQFFLRQGGMIVKLLSQLLLKCFNMEVQKRPYVEWMTVILSEVKSSLDFLY